MTRKIVAVSAGLSVPSTTRLLTDRLAAAVEAQVSARGEGVDVEVVELRDYAADLAATMTSGGLPTPIVARLRDLVSSADAVIAVTPVFSASYSGLFKMFVDVLDPDSLTGMPVLVAATAGSVRHSLVLDHAMRPLFAYLRAMVVPTGVFAATEDFGADPGALTDRITRAATELTSLALGAVRSDAPGSGSDRSVASRRSGNDLPEEVTPFEQLLGNLG